jgi:hypothetical protein
MKEYLKKLKVQGTVPVLPAEGNRGSCLENAQFLRVPLFYSP